LAPKSQAFFANFSNFSEKVFGLAGERLIFCLEFAAKWFILLNKVKTQI
jgi:hypothetical protein